MKIASHYYKCSIDYLDSISPNIKKEIDEILNKLPDKNDPDSLSVDLFWLLSSKGWAFGEIPTGLNKVPPKYLNLSLSLDDIAKSNTPEFCKTSSSPEIETKSDFAKKFNNQLVHIEIQTDDLEKIASDLIKFRIAFAEKRVQAGIEIIVQNGKEHNTFENAKEILIKLDIDCPIWVIGIPA